jgi:hypothetical protein
VQVEIVNLEYDYDFELNGQILLGAKTEESVGKITQNNSLRYYLK